MPLAVLRSLTEVAADASVVSRLPGINDTALAQHTVAKPSGSGGSLLVCFTSDAASVTASTTSAGWASLGTEQQGATTNHRGTVFYAANADSCDTLVVDLSTAEQATWVAMRVANGGIPEIASGNGSGTPYTLPTATPTGGTGNYLSILYVGSDSSATTAQDIGFPAGWGNQQSVNPGVTSSAATFTAEQAWTGVSTIYPGSFTMSVPEQWVAFHIVFPRGSGSGSGGSGGTVDATPFFLSAV